MKVVHYAVVLGLICLLAAFGVAGTYRTTKGPIDEKARADRNEAQSAALGIAKDQQVEFRVTNSDAEESEQVIAARAAGKTLGYAAVGAAQGYGGKVVVMVGMDPQAEKIIGMKIVRQSETPGLGSRIEEVKSDKTWWRILTRQAADAKRETMPEFLKQFRGRKIDEVILGGDDGIQGITGATISSNAVVEATRRAMGKIRENAR